MTNQTMLQSDRDITLPGILPNQDIQREANNIVNKLLKEDKTKLFNSKDSEFISVYTQLLPFFDKSNESLDPSPIINNALTNLVNILQGEMLSNNILKTYFPYISKEACELIDKDLELSSRADKVREIASRAESRLELHYVKRILSLPCPEKDTLKSMNYVQRIECASREFPYIGNYITMVEKEARVISSIKTPKHIVFCGSGPLPFTGFLLAAHTRSKVSFIDNDEDAVNYSRELISRWEENDIIPRGLVQVIHADGKSVRFLKTDVEVRESNRTADGLVNIRCDVLFIAALIPNDVKESMAQNVAEIGEAGPLVILRTAHGLTARLAYNASNRACMQNHLNLIATVVPKVHQVSSRKPPITDLDTLIPMDWFPNEILNSLEIYGCK